MSGTGKATKPKARFLISLCKKYVIAIAMFCIRYYKTVVVTPFKQQVRYKTIFHRGWRHIFKDENLLWTNSITSGLCMVMGDLIQQEFEHETHSISNKYDWARAGRMFIVGTLMGPLHHYYYLHLDRILPKADLRTVVQKVLCDQLFASPATIVCFYYGMGILEKKTIRESTEEVKLKFKYVYMGDCCFWPPIQIINFYYLPSSYRVVYINFATMIFNIFLSYMKHYDQR